MIVLGIESCGDIGSVALASEEKIIGEITINVKKNHSITLAPMVADLLRLANMEVKDLDAIAVDVGPGSFTGLRIGISLASSLAYGQDKPVVRVTGLDALLSVGRRLLKDSPDYMIIPIIFGRKNEAYVLYEGEAKVVDVVDFLKGLKKDVRYLFIGDGYLAFKDLISEIGLDSFEVDDSFHYLKGGVIASCGLTGLKEGKGISPIAVEPVYLRRPEVDINLEMKLKLNDKC
jgi:tRNA threonylcarbamoyladenosine biosynthesis protein TsaB